MRLLALASIRKLIPATAIAVLLTLATTPSHAQDDPPNDAGRLSFISGNVSVQPEGVDSWGQAYTNLVIGPGDRVFTDSSGRAEIQVGAAFLRIGPNSDVSFLNVGENGAIHFGVAQGSVHVRTPNPWHDQTVGVLTPNGTGVVNSLGDMRIDVLPDEDATVFTNFASYSTVMGAGGFGEHVPNGQSLELLGTNPVEPQWLDAAPLDDLDNWSQYRDRQLANVRSYQYVSPMIPGVAELDEGGTWTAGTEYGAIWFPNHVRADWQPYHNGHWVNHAPWGWVWVEDESWGYAPFHYGRWVAYNGRWGWIPGPPASRPVWSPALVVFAGGIHVGGVGVSAWFPLGPGEAYRPWYHCSPHYIDRVNISNITPAPRVHVEVTYVNIVNNVNITNITYVNRTTAVTAMNHQDFAAGRPAQQAAVKVDVHVMEHVQPLAAPLPKPTAQSFVGRAPARPVPVAVARPVLMNEQGKLISTKPGSQPVAPPVKPAPPPKPLPGHVVVAPPPGAHTQPASTPAVAGKPASSPMPAPAAPVKPAPVAAPVPKPAAQPLAKPMPPPPATPVPPIPAKPVPPPPVSKPIAPAPTVHTVPPPVEKPVAPPQLSRPSPPPPVSKPIAPAPTVHTVPPPVEKPVAPPQVSRPSPPPPVSKPIVPAPTVHTVPPPVEKPVAPPQVSRPSPPPPARSTPLPVKPTPPPPPAVAPPVRPSSPPPAAKPTPPPVARPLPPPPQPPAAKPVPPPAPKPAAPPVAKPAPPPGNPPAKTNKDKKDQNPPTK